MLRNLRERSGSESGFTLIELLVVVLILGILAAIAVPSFLNQRQKAQDSEAKAAVRTSQTAGETYATENDGVYTGATDAKLEVIEPSLLNANSFAVTVTDGDTIQYDVVSKSSDATKYSIKVDAGTVTRSCDDPGKGGCKSDSTW